MHASWIIAKRELGSFFDSLIAYIMLVLFLGFSGFFMAAEPDISSSARQALNIL
jgi:hypothetical protein